MIYNNESMLLKETFQSVKEAGKALPLIPDERRNEVLNAVADAIVDKTDILLEANRKDLGRMEPDNPLYDRLLLNEKRLADMASDMRRVATLPSPLGRVLKQKVLENGLRLRRVSVPFGVIGMIYEARPNVTFDVFALCFKSGNACILKGGKDADDSNRAGVALIHDVLRRFEIPSAVVELLPATHEATGELLNAVGYVDLCIPRGSKRLINFVRDTARVPVIETGAGVVHAYFDEYGNAEMGSRIINNAKTRRPSVCNALDTLIVHESRLADLPELCSLLPDHRVRIYADAPARQALSAHYPPELLFSADDNTFGTEFMDYAMGVKTVGSLDEALAHIATFGSGHSECIITDNADCARHFETMVDAACVYVNAPTSFTDGAQFGLGAEIGISTQKLGARGPMALEEMTTYKWLIEGEGQVRE